MPTDYRGDLAINTEADVMLYRTKHGDAMGSPLEPDVLIGEDFRARYRPATLAERSPTSRLQGAVLEQAMDDLRMETAARRAGCHRDEAADWIRRDDADHPFTFVVVCQAFGLDVDATRAALLAIVAPGPRAVRPYPGQHGAFLRRADDDRSDADLLRAGAWDAISRRIRRRQRLTATVMAAAVAHRSGWTCDDWTVAGWERRVRPSTPNPTHRVVLERWLRTLAPGDDAETVAGAS